jgi:cobalt-zinc-cadmium efflux system outer membrane protein
MVELPVRSPRSPVALSAALALALALAPVVGAEPMTAPRPSGAITLAEAIAAAEARSPGLAAMAWQVRAEEGRVVQAGLLPNPELSLEAEDFGGSGSRPAFEKAQTTLSLAQLVELGGKRRRRRELATLDRELAGWDRETARLDLMARVTKAFVAALAAQERLALSEALVAVARESARAAGKQVEAGVASPVERVRADVAVSRGEARRRMRERERDVARAALAAACGSEEATFQAVRGDLEAIAPPPSLGRVAAALRTGPRLARWGTEVARGEAAVAVEESRRMPDVRVRFGGRRFEDDGSEALVGELSVPLPLFDRNQGAIEAARARFARARFDRDAALAGAHAELVEAYGALAVAYEKAVILRDQVLPEADAALAQTRAAYRQGGMPMADVLLAQQTLVELREERLEALAAYHLAVAEVERLTATPVVAREED